MNQTVLVLNTRDGWDSQPAMLLSSNGQQEEMTCFEHGDTTEAYGSCGVNWRNELFIFGGYNEKRQISRLSGRKLERVGSLSFVHRWGAYSVMKDEIMYLCFNAYSSNDYKRCRRSNGPLEQFSEIALSNHDHRQTQTACSESESFC